MLIGYERVSTDDQNLALQHDALQAAGCEKIFSDKMSGAKADRPGLQEAFEFARKGDTIVVWRLDRLGRSLKDLITSYLYGGCYTGGRHLATEPALNRFTSTTAFGTRLVFKLSDGIGCQCDIDVLFLLVVVHPEAPPTLFPFVTVLPVRFWHRSFLTIDLGFLGCIVE